MGALGCPDGTRIVVEVADVRGRQVRLAVTAPPEVAVTRREVSGR
ncbi:MAG: carbon storage regulator [Actinobacteria bacterium]|nr:carbon storage regulator [Actinomycetota bacterium]